MATEWFYTTNKQQMGPVSWSELRELAEVGILKPQDLVWSEGMDEWVKAKKQDGLFAESEIEEASTRSKRSSYAEPTPPAGRRTRRKDEGDAEEAEEEESEPRRKRRKRESAGMSPGLKIGLILAAVFFVLLVGGGCVGGLIWMLMRSGQKDGPVRENYTIAPLNQQQENSRRFNFTKGRRVVITVTNNLNVPPADVDLHIFRGNAPMPLIVDVRVPREDRNCRLEFVVPDTDSYRVQVVNLGPGRANSCHVVIDEQ